MDQSSFELFAAGRSNSTNVVRSLLQLEHMSIARLSTLKTPNTSPRHMQPSAGAWTHNAMADFHKKLLPGHAKDGGVARQRRFDNKESEKKRPGDIRQLIKKYGLNPARWAKAGKPNLGNSRFALTDKGTIKNRRRR